MSNFLNQARAGLLTWSLIITFVHKSMRVCVYVYVCMYALEAINN